MTMNRRKFLVRGVTAGGLAVMALPGFGQDKFPNKPIRIISAYPPGGAVDVAARSVGDAIRKILGQPSIVENKIGANGMIGAQYVSQALPDGYTMLMGSPSETTRCSCRPPPNINLASIASAPPWPRPAIM